MPNITLTVTTAVLDRITAAYSAVYGYSPTQADGTPNPTTPEAFVKSMVAAEIKATLRKHEGTQSRLQAEARVNTDVVIT